MKELLERATALEIKALDWGVRATQGEVDRLVAAEMEDVRAKHSRGAFLMTDPTKLAAYEEQYRGSIDANLRTDATLLEAEQQAVVSSLDDAIASAEGLKSNVDRFGTSGQNVLLATIVDELQLARVRQDVAGLTRAQLLARYERWSDDADNATVRTVEAAVLAGELDRLGIAPDRDSDVQVIPKLRAAVEARRRGRVPAELIASREKAQKALSTVRTKIGLLRDGFGIASRPRVSA